MGYRAIPVRIDGSCVVMQYAHASNSNYHLQYISIRNCSMALQPTVRLVSGVELPVDVPPGSTICDLIDEIFNELRERGENVGDASQISLSTGAHRCALDAQVDGEAEYVVVLPAAGRDAQSLNAVLLEIMRVGMLKSEQLILNLLVGWGLTLEVVSFSLFFSSF